MHIHTYIQAAAESRDDHLEDLLKKKNAREHPGALPDGGTGGLNGASDTAGGRMERGAAGGHAVGVLGGGGTADEERRSNEGRSSGWEDVER